MDARNVFCKQTVDRRIPLHIRVIQFLLYVSVVICAFLGTMWGTFWLFPSLGALFLAWYMMGEARVSYEYIIEGYSFKALRTSGMRSRLKTVDFLHLDLKDMIIMAEDGLSLLDEAEITSKEAVPRRITYDISAHNVNLGCYVLYAFGIDEEAGRYLKVYFSPNAELLKTLRMLCPGKVYAE